MSLLKRLTFFTLACCALVPIQAQAAADYPTRPIHLVVTFAAGSSSDVAGRILGAKLGDLLGQTIVIDNRPGASGIVASEYVARAQKDGYTLLLATIANTINTTLLPGKGPNFQKAFAPIALAASVPNILVVNPSVKANNVKELIAYAKANPDALNYGASGVGSGPRMATELFKQMAGIQMTGILYPGSAQTVTDLVAGRVQVEFAPASSVLGLIKQGSIKALATSQAKRTSAAPDLPTVAESGLPGYDTGVWYGILAPAGTPQPVVDKLSKAINEALKDPKTLEQLHGQGMDALGSTPDEFAHYIDTETKRWADVLHKIDAEKKK
jgi:tripartite-type tricarboxylate transporter receptor subunit TctC